VYGLPGASISEAESLDSAEGGEGLITYAVVETGGKQYRVQVGDTFRVERLEGEAGQEITLDRVHMVGGDDSVKFGTPLVAGAAVKAEILSQARAGKVLVFKFKSKKNYRRMRGHRQYYTEIRIKEIIA
jgi:large subunit ribosomal protein L21